MIKAILSIFYTTQVWSVFDGNASMGSENPTITIEEYSDLSCPTCASLEKLCLPKLLQEFHNVKIVLKDYPVHPIGIKAAIGIRYKDEQEYLRLRKILFETLNTWKKDPINNPVNLKKVLQDNGVKASEYNLDDPQISVVITNTLRTQLPNPPNDLTVPFFIVDGKIIQDCNAVKNAIRALAAKTKSNK